MNRPPSFFNNPMAGPNTGVNWAQLAQRWIAERGTNEYEQYPQQYPQAPPSTGNYYDNAPSMAPQSHQQPPQQQYGSFFLPPPTTQNRPYRAPPPLHSIPPPNAPPPVPYANYGNPYASALPTGNGTPQRPLFQSHAHEAANMPAYGSNIPNTEQSYEHGDAPQWYSGPAWSDPATMQWMAMGDWSAYDANAVIDQQMRTKLPAWILEGLEKAENEKQKKAQKELEKKRAADEEKQREKRRKEKGLGKFDTDSEDEEDERNDRRASSSSSTSKLDTKPTFAPQSKIGHKRKSRDIDEQEFRDNEMSAIKRIVTDVLLNSSEKALSDIVHRYLNRVRSKQKPTVIKNSSALAGLASIVGYSDDEESD